ncbi:MAG: aldehyde dehydrogenase (NADP(+)) [Puniceicoccaceae bacterium]
MSLHGLSLIGSTHAQAKGTPFHGINPATGQQLEPPFYPSSSTDTGAACQLAAKAFPVYRKLAPHKRAEFLRAIASGIEGLGDELINRYREESGLPEERALGERGRTCLQLNQFATLLESKHWNRAHSEEADPGRQPLPKPALARQLVAIGPVAIFGPANFPLAYDVAGGDTAAALAAGCPVVVKAHAGHPGTSELVGQAILNAADTTGMPEGVFSLLFDSGTTVGSALVQHPVIKAVGFTGSERGGRALFDLAASRPEPIPVFAEMSSINPVSILPRKLSRDARSLAAGFVGSLTLGVGQFCTNPGLVLLPDTADAERFIDEVLNLLRERQPEVMLNGGIHESYLSGLKRLSGTGGVTCLLNSGELLNAPGFRAGPALFKVDSGVFASQPELREEVFGPASLLVICREKADYLTVLEAIGGQLTASIHAMDEDLEDFPELIGKLETKAGRIICNGWPTGVEVCPAMVHGGPYPATTDSRFTAVGIQSISRFLRPVCYQNFSKEALEEI